MKLTATNRRNRGNGEANSPVHNKTTVTTKHMKTKTRLLSYSLSLLTTGATLLGALAPAHAADKKPNIVIIWGDDVGQSDISAYTMGLMGFRTPNIDRIAKEGVIFTDYYAEQSCTAGRASFITGQCGLRTGNTKVG